MAGELGRVSTLENLGSGRSWNVESSIQAIAGRSVIPLGLLDDFFDLNLYDVDEDFRSQDSIRDSFFGQNLKVSGEPIVLDGT